ncbi:MAG: hypothetical protein JSS66_17305 [Armatimonadetes bacterium]|nr:hypothetical protein [Armatimonadota bacterium]
MNQPTKMTALAVLSVAFVVASAQQFAARTGGKDVVIGGSDSATRVSDGMRLRPLSGSDVPVGKGWSAVRLNGIQQALSRYLISELQSEYLTKSGEDDKKSNLVLVKENYYMRAMMSPAQQKQFDDNVLETNRYPAIGEWKTVRQAPTIVKAILTCTPDQERQISKLNSDLESVFKEMTDRLPHANGRPTPTDAWKHEWVSRGASANEAFYAGVHRVLTPEQAKEWDAFLQKAENEMILVTATK